MYTLTVHLYANDDPESIEKIKLKLIEAARVYRKDKETADWLVMQDVHDPRAFTIVERFEQESVGAPPPLSPALACRRHADAGKQPAPGQLQVVWGKDGHILLTTGGIALPLGDYRARNTTSRTPTGRRSTRMWCRCSRSPWICEDTRSWIPVRTWSSPSKHPHWTGACQDTRPAGDTRLRRDGG